MKYLHMVSFILVSIGGLNWGLVGLGWLVGGGANWNVVEMILGGGSMLSGVVYILVGLGAVYLLVDHKNTCKMCSGGMGGM